MPQELGDFGILVNSGWDRKKALLYNVASGSTFLLGGLVAYALAGSLEIAFLVPFAAGNFAYIGGSDLLPELTTDPALTSKVTDFAFFVLGLGILWAAATFPVAARTRSDLWPCPLALVLETGHCPDRRQNSRLMRTEGVPSWSVSLLWGRSEVPGLR